MKKFLLSLMIIVLLSGCSINKENDNSGNISKDDIMTNAEEIPEGSFLLAVDGVYSIPGRGITVSGEIVNGTIKKGDEIEIVGSDNVKTTKAKSIALSTKQVESATKGDNVSILLESDIVREDVKKGDVLATPGIISNHTEFKANIYVLTVDEKGGENPIISESTQQFFFRTEETTGTINLENKALNLGESGTATIKLDRGFAFYKGKVFYIRNNGKIIAYGKVSEIIK